VQAVLDFCTQADPKDKASFQAISASIVRGASAQQVAGDEHSGGYTQDYQMIISQLIRMPSQDVAKNCAAGAAQWRGPVAANPNPNPRHGGDARDGKLRDR
jgi:hypothetical protein